MGGWVRCLSTCSFYSHRLYDRSIAPKASEQASLLLTKLSLLSVAPEYCHITVRKNDSSFSHFFFFFFSCIWKVVVTDCVRISQQWQKTDSRLPMTCCDIRDLSPSVSEYPFIAFKVNVVCVFFETIMYLPGFLDASQLLLVWLSLSRSNQI